MKSDIQMVDSLFRRALAYADENLARAETIGDASIWGAITYALKTCSRGPIMEAVGHSSTEYKQDIDAVVSALTPLLSEPANSRTSLMIACNLAILGGVADDSLRIDRGCRVNETFEEKFVHKLKSQVGKPLDESMLNELRRLMFALRAHLDIAALESLFDDAKQGAAEARDMVLESDKVSRPSEYMSKAARVLLGRDKLEDIDL